MSNETSPQVQSLEGVRLTLRSHLVFTPQVLAGRLEYYQVEDPILGRFFRFGPAEYTFIASLDGQTSIEKAFANLSNRMPQHSLTLSEAIGLCKWLVDMDLVWNAKSVEADRLVGRSEHAKKLKRRSNLNPVSFRIPMMEPDPLLRALLPFAKCLFTGWAAFLGGLLAVVGAVQIAIDWPRFIASANGIFADGNWIWLLVSWLMLKVLHELSHGITCTYYGGHVREAGLQFLWFVPLPYVDVTSSWRFRSRWERIQVAAAGMLAEFFIAGIAAIVWSRTEPGLINHIAYSVVIMASLSTLLFNANPLMKLDGYYILSDAIGIPNLYSQGQRRVRAAVNRIGFGISTRVPDRNFRQSLIIAIYGWLSMIWRVVIVVSLTVACSRAFGQAGPWIVGMATGLWLSVMAIQLGRFLFSTDTKIRPQRKRIASVVSGSLILMVASLAWVPWPEKRQAPAVVDYAPPIFVRAAGNGWVMEICVQPGQHVKAEELLLVQSNPDLSNRIATLEILIKESEVRERRFQQKGQVALQQSEVEEHEALKVELDEKKLEAVKLEVRAPQDGIVIHRQWNRVLGAYLRTGDEILSLGDESKKELRVSISQDDIDIFKQQVGATIQVDVPGHSMFDGRLDKIIPRASLKPIHPALISLNGGSLPIRHRPNRAEDAESIELFSPQLEGIVSLDESRSRQLFVGQRASVSHRAYDESIGQHLLKLIDRAIRYERRTHSSGL